MANNVFVLHEHIASIWNHFYTEVPDAGFGNFQRIDWKWQRCNITPSDFLVHLHILRSDRHIAQTDHSLHNTMCTSTETNGASMYAILCKIHIFSYNGKFLKWKNMNSVDLPICIEKTHSQDSSEGFQSWSQHNNPVRRERAWKTTEKNLEWLELWIAAAQVKAKHKKDCFLLEKERWKLSNCQQLFSSCCHPGLANGFTLEVNFSHQDHSILKTKFAQIWQLTQTYSEFLCCLSYSPSKYFVCVFFSLTRNENFALIRTLAKHSMRKKKKTERKSCPFSGTLKHLICSVHVHRKHNFKWLNFNIYNLHITRRYTWSVNMLAHSLILHIHTSLTRIFHFSYKFVSSILAGIHIVAAHRNNRRARTLLFQTN